MTAFLPWAINAPASRRAPVPQSKIRRSPLSVVNSTHEVLPPKWFVPGPGVAIDPRVPQKRTLMILRLPCVRHRPIGNSISLFVRVRQTLPAGWCQNIVGIGRLQSDRQRPGRPGSAWATFPRPQSPAISPLRHSRGLSPPRSHLSVILAASVPRDLTSPSFPRKRESSVVGRSRYATNAAGSPLSRGRWLVCRNRGGPHYSSFPRTESSVVAPTALCDERHWVPAFAGTTVSVP